MKKTKRYLFLLVALLMAIAVRAYKIEAVNATFGSIPEIRYGSSATSVTVNTTDIPSGQIVTMTVTPNDGYYLSSLVYEEVTDLGWALAPQRRAPNIQTIHTIPIQTTLTYAEAHFGGTYTFNMPENNVIITATFVECTSIISANLYWDSWDGTSALPQSKVYDGTAHTMKVRVGDTELTKDRHYTTTAYTLTNVDNITPTIMGIGEYNGSISGTTMLSITQQPLTITAQPQTITYGSSIQTGISYVNVSGLVTNDALTGVTLTPSTSQVTTTGTITPSGATTTKGISNYAVTYNTGALTIQAYDLSAVALSDDVLDIDLDKYYFNYDGSLHKAQVTSIKYQNTPLTSGTSYTYDYAKLGVYTGSIGTGNEANPENPVDYKTSDIYTIVITFCGNYTGTKTVKYQIRPEVLLNNSAYRWRTFYESTYNMKVPTGASGFQAYTVSDVNINAVEVADRQYIKAGVPMLLYKPGDNYQFYPELVEPGDGHLSDWSASGYYKRNASDWNLGTNVDILNETKKVWVLVRDKFVRSMSGTLEANKCYLELSGSTPVYFSPELNLNPILTGIETPIESRNDKRVVSEWYTLDGRKIQGIPSKKGIYITNGKKIIIK